MYKRYDSAALTDFIHTAIAKPGGDFQSEILHRILEGDGFVEWLDQQIKFGTGEQDIVFPAESVKLEAGEYVGFTKETIRMYYLAWKELQLSDTSSSSFWAYVTRQAIVKNIVSPHSLALSSTEGSSLKDSTGKHKIEGTLSFSGDKPIKQMDHRIRNFIRNLCGFVPRGARSIYQDCPFARAWWQCYVAQSVSPNDWEKEILPVLWERGLWREISEKMASSLTVIGDVRIRSGIILHLREQREDRWIGKNVEELLSQVGVMCAWRSLGYFPPEKVKEFVDEIADSAFSKNSNGNTQTT